MQRATERWASQCAAPQEGRQPCGRVCIIRYCIAGLSKRCIGGAVGLSPTPPLLSPSLVGRSPFHDARSHHHHPGPAWPAPCAILTVLLLYTSTIQTALYFLAARYEMVTERARERARKRETYTHTHTQRQTPERGRGRERQRERECVYWTSPVTLPASPGSRLQPPRDRALSAVLAAAPHNGPHNGVRAVLALENSVGVRVCSP